jgi:pimeloyl-ACP methyl ester carboxylesterase
MRISFLFFLIAGLSNLIFLSTNAQNVFKVTKATSIGYLEYLPSDYSNNSEKYPIVIFLHGLGERGPISTDYNTLQGGVYKVERNGPPKHVKYGTDFPFILISPQLKSNFGDWPAWYIMEVIDYCKTYLRIDERRIYLTGLSLGGGGAWVGAQDFPELFAAVAPVCGSRNSTSKAGLLVDENLPVWGFHGDKDSTVPMSRTINMVNAINACQPIPKPMAKITIYPGVGHNAWDNAYKPDHSIHNPNVYEWMLSYTNTSNGSNKIPVADAGSDKAIEGTSIELAGTGSDSDGSLNSYSWEKISGPSATLANTNTPKLTATGLTAGSYMFRLQVKDAKGDTDSDYIKVTVKSGKGSGPIVSAGGDKSVTLPVNYTIIEGSAKDEDGSITSYTWSKVSGGTVTLGDASSSKLNVSNLIAGSYVFRLTVKDNDGLTKSDDMKLTVKSDVGPVVSAGADKSLTLPVNYTTIEGSAKDDGGSITSYQWSKVSGSTVTLANASSSKLNVSNLISGSYVFRLTVKDSNGVTKNDDMKLTVKAGTSNMAPVVSAGVDRVVSLPASTVTLFGTASDSDGKIVSYKWTKISGGDCSFSNSNALRPTISHYTSGTYVFRITVKDDDGAVRTDDVTVKFDNPPIVNAGGDKSIKLPTSTFTIAGSASDSDGSIKKYTWSKYSGPELTLTNKESSKVTLSRLLKGTYVLRLSAWDNSGLQTSDMITINVQ